MLDALVHDRARVEYAAANRGQTVRRRYVNPGDTVLVVLPHTAACRQRQLAGRSARVRIGEFDAELDLPLDSDHQCLSHLDTGVYRDPVKGGLYILQTTEGPATADH